MYFHSQNLQYMQNLQRECTHSFFKKAAFRVDLHPLKNQKSLKTSGFVPTQNNKKSLIEWARPRHPHPDTHAHAHRWKSPSPLSFHHCLPVRSPPETLRLYLSGGGGRPPARPLFLAELRLSPYRHQPLSSSLAVALKPPDNFYPPTPSTPNRLRPAIAPPRPGGRQLLCGDARISLIFFA